MIRAAEASFLGSHTGRIDAKGRAAAPADFRRALDLKTFNGFFCVPSLQGPYLECGGPDFIARLKAMIAGLDPYDPDRRSLVVSLLGQARTVAFDSDGRFILPEPLKLHARLTDAIFYLGTGDTFEIWRAEDAEAFIDGEQERARSALQRLRNPASSQLGGAA